MADRLLVVLALLLAAIPCACRTADGVQRDVPRPTEDGGGQPERAPTLQERRSDAYIGVVLSGERVDVAPAVLAEIVAVHVRAGDEVEEGQSIATFDARRAREDLRMADATLRSERAALGQARIDREAAARRLAETETLHAAGAASRGAVDDAKLEHRRAKAAEARAAASVSQWTTNLEQLERELEDTEVRAPFSGTVAQRYLDPGAVAGPGAPVVRVISSAVLWIRFAVPPHELDDLEVGLLLDARIEEPAIETRATIRRIAPETDHPSQLVFVDAELELSAALRSRVKAGASAWIARER